ncbi:ribosome biogenesis GTPase Der [Aureibacter tunicatorum]|uniref:GTPase Der n=1 Tax=Aureibacter tunicatorum TaxID=866807 RepID=A0AAE4BRG9_9BACT|nr:ribosome biogenesis GTPase Der [Aureibacter tunicatorum]MDR6237928.1 GTP-binding protein [Aureibacter tunicatorum]BDD02961.1 GTPase Der [Aureibacter tunicatorum]
MANIVAIVGRPNVGKSTLFNRLIEQKKAIMDDESGVTRDRHYGYGEWTGKNFTVIDTGGYVVGSEDIFEQAIREQVKEAIEEATVVLFMVDTHTGLTDLDKDFANILREINKPVILTANKSDNTKYIHESMEFYELGMGEVFPVAAASGAGTGELLDHVVTHFKDNDDDNPDEGVPRIAILGRPNAGKSSFVNLLLGRERSIVTDIAGTTRDAVNSRYKAFGKDFILTDTAGIRKKSRVHEDIEFYSVMRAIQALQDSDVCVIMIDAERGFEAQDMNIINLAHKYKRGVMIMVNKWDLIEKSNNTMEQFRKEIKAKLGPLGYIPIIFTSVINKQRVFQAIELAMEIHENLNKRIPTSELNDFMLSVIEAYPPPAVKGKYIRIKYVTQLPTKHPSIAFFCNLPQYIKESYQRYLENKFRDQFGFEGVPVNFYFRQK